MKKMDSEVKEFHNHMANSMSGLMKAFNDGFAALDKAKKEESAIIQEANAAPAAPAKEEEQPAAPAEDKKPEEAEVIQEREAAPPAAEATDAPDNA